MAATRISEQQLKLKAATRRLVKEAGTQEEAARVLGMHHSIIGHWGQPERSESYIRADAIIALEKEAGQPIVTELLADEAGYELRPRRVEMVQMHPVRGSLDRLARIVKEIGELGAAVHEAIQDQHHLSAAEISSLLKELGDIKSVAVRWEGELFAMLAARQAGTIIRDDS